MYGIYLQTFERQVWELLDVTMTFSKTTILSWLAGKTGTVGEIGGWTSVFLRRIPYIGTGLTIAEAIGALEDKLKDRESIALGQVLRLKSTEPWIHLDKKLIE